MILYADVNRRDWIDAATLIRWRHRFRGPRESEKINAEIGQELYDFRQLYDKSVVMDTALTSNLQSIEYGATPSGITFYRATDATPSFSQVAFLGVEKLAVQLDRLEKRIRTREI